MVIFVFPFIMYLRTKETRYIIYCLLCLSGNLIEVKRTPLVGIMAMVSLFLLFKYKIKAFIPLLLGICAVIFAVLYIPALREKMFFDGVDLDDIGILFSPELFTVVNSSGRTGMWETVINQFYEGNEMTGVGLGTMKAWLRSKDNLNEHFLRLHNDWLHLLCETGKIGVGLLLMFFLSIYYKCFKQWCKHNSDDLRLIALSCAMASIGTMVHMFFENCIGLYGFYMPFIFGAMYLHYQQIE